MSATQEARSHFVYLLRPKRPATVKDLTPEEEAILDEHRVYLRSLAEAGCLVLAGRCPIGGLRNVAASAILLGLLGPFLGASPQLARYWPTALILLGLLLLLRPRRRRIR